MSILAGRRIRIWQCKQAGKIRFSTAEIPSLNSNSRARLTPLFLFGNISDNKKYAFWSVAKANLVAGNKPKNLKIQELAVTHFECLLDQSYVGKLVPFHRICFSTLYSLRLNVGQKSHTSTLCFVPTRKDTSWELFPLSQGSFPSPLHYC